MKKFVLISTLVYLIGLTAYTQSLELNYEGNALAPGGVICVFDTAADVVYSISGIGVKNKTSQAIDVKVKKVELQVVPGTENSFCWGVCEPPSVYISSMSVSFAANATDKSSFVGDYTSHGHAGKTIVRYIFFNAANVNDSVSFICEYLAGSGVGISKTIANVSTISNAFPNPAKSEVNMTFSLNLQENAKLEVRNILGIVVKQVTITDTKGELKLDVSDLNNGAYFYTLVVDSKAITTKRFIVQR